MFKFLFSIIIIGVLILLAIQDRPEKNADSNFHGDIDKEWFEAPIENATTFIINPVKYTFKNIKSVNNGFFQTSVMTLAILLDSALWDSFIIKLIAIIASLLIVSLIIFYRAKIYRSQKKQLEEMVRERTRELSELNTILEEKQEEISIQNEELTKHRTNLERLVNERTEALKSALKRAEEADRLKSAFLANMSHEIRTPMNAIVGFVTLLSNDDITEEEHREYLEIITHNSETLMVLINDILEISLIEANQLKLNKFTFNVTKILEELHSFYHLRNQKDIDLVFVNKKDEQDLYMHSDKTRFRQIFTNLLNNAFKYTESGKISFGYEKQNEEVKFFVSDTGIGIAESEYDNIFNYFHKIDKGENKLYRGAGIGLSISNKLVELMGGKIWLNSSIGKGTSFYFTLPPSDGIENIKPEEHDDTKKNNNLEGVTVVVAEDDTTNYRLIEKILKPTKATVIWAENGIQAVEKVSALKSTKNCIVLMDIKMPLLNGINATKMIKKVHPEIPVVAVTAFAQSKDKDQILKKNFIDYIAKPLIPDQLLIKIFKYAFINEQN